MREGIENKKQETIIHDSILEVEWSHIPSGKFVMGSMRTEGGLRDNDGQHEVKLSKSFLMMTTPVTQRMWESVMGDNPSYFRGGADHPVEQVSWEDTQKFIDKLNKHSGNDGLHRLPTEAEWEYACRAGTTTAFWSGDCTESEGKYPNLDRVGWFTKNSGDQTHPVGQKPANPWGLHDMHGNVWEWCNDWKGSYPRGSVTDPVGPDTGSGRVVRGGSWDFPAWYCRSARRGGLSPDNRCSLVGIRLARSV